MNKKYFYLFLAIFYLNITNCFGYNQYVQTPDSNHNFNVSCSNGSNIVSCTNEMVDGLVKNDFELNVRIVTLANAIRDLESKIEELEDKIQELESRNVKKINVKKGK